jgi:hypothetical protein
MQLTDPMLMVAMTKAVEEGLISPSVMKDRSSEFWPKLRNVLQYALNARPSDWPTGHYSDADGSPRFASMIPLLFNPYHYAYLSVPASMSQDEFNSLLEMLNLWARALVKNEVEQEA